MKNAKTTYPLWQRLCDDLHFASKNYRRRLALTDREEAVSLHYRHICKRPLPLDNPTTLTEWIQWLKLYGDTTAWTTLSDKYAVRDYVAQCGLADHLNKLYAVYEDPADIQWDALPDSFILKPNNGCHSNIVIHDKQKANRQEVTQALRQAFDEPFGLTTAEFHYLGIKPKVTAEQLLQQPENPHGLIDYKLYCIGGQVRAILTCEPTQGPKPVKTLLDPDWQVRADYNPRPVRAEEVLPRPAILPELLNAAQTLAKPFPLVRIDYYILHNQPIFGEMTFTPAGGYKPYGTDLFKQEMGQLLTQTILS
ncbi:MAG: hypothetical protein IKU03_03385 [Bacteroidales bacterium]|nr:hypothetical protein [Bacteroidales bacterium]